MEVVFAMCHWNLEVHLLERCWDSQYLSVDFAHEDWQFSWCPGKLFQSSHFRCNGSCEEKSLPFCRWRKNRQAFFNVWQHASNTSTCQQPIRFVQNYHPYSSKRAYRVLPRSPYVICQPAWRRNYNMGSLSKSCCLWSHIRASSN